jgi:VanZ family protein
MTDGYVNGRSAASAAADRSTFRVCLGLYCLFIVYGSFIPFRFSVAAEVVRENVSRIQLYPFQGGRKNFSIPDVASNVLLFVPFGFLVVGIRSRAASGWSSVGSLAGAGGLALVFGTMIEIGQLFSPGRTASPLDVAANTVGGIGGAVMSRWVARSAVTSLGTRIGRAVRREGAVLSLALLVVALAFDSFYPFAVTFDVSTAVHNLRHAQWVPFESFGRRFWADILVDHGVTLALLAALARRWIEGLAPRGSAGRTAWLATSTLAGVLEAGKLFFEGRAPKVDNILVASVGALVGVTIVPTIARSRPARARPGLTLLGLAVALLAYAELTPFDFALGGSAISAKVAKIEWLPLASYYGADPQSALFDLWNKLLLSGFLGFSLTAAMGSRPRGSLAGGLMAGSILEAAQILKVTRTPSVTDVMIFGAGAYIGGKIYGRYQEWKRWRVIEE